MTIASGIIARVSATLVDEAHDRWSEAELLGYVSDAQKELTLLKPSAYTKVVSHRLAEGARQTIPADGTNLIDIKHNKGTSGTDSGASVREIDRSVLESWLPDWRAATPDTNAQYFIYDDRTPTEFEVYPPQPAVTGYVELAYCAVPPDLATTSDPLVVHEIYDTVIVNLTLANALKKSTSALSVNQALAYQNLAHSLISGRKPAKPELHPEQIAERVKR